MPRSSFRIEPPLPTIASLLDFFSASVLRCGDSIRVLGLVLTYVSLVRALVVLTLVGPGGCGINTRLKGDVPVDLWTRVFYAYVWGFLN